MAIPIRPTNSFNSEFINYFPINMDLLQSDLFTNSSLKKTALANDKDADILFFIWKNSSVINNADTIDKKKYRVKENVNKDDLLKLKASGLIVGNDKEIHFTNKAASIIKTMVLGEQNSFGKQSIKKPYSIILAEEKKPKRKSTLALASNMTKEKNLNMLKFAQGWQDVKKDNYYYNDRVISKGVASPTSNKEYNVRIYKNNLNAAYEVWTFWGRTNGTMNSKKDSSFFSFIDAKDKAESIIDEKKYGSNKYVAAIQKGYPPVNGSIPGEPVKPGEQGSSSHKFVSDKEPSKSKMPKSVKEKEILSEPVKEKELSEKEKEEQRLKSVDQIAESPVDRDRLDELRKALISDDEVEASNKFNLKKHLFSNKKTAVHVTDDSDEQEGKKLEDKSDNAVEEDKKPNLTDSTEIKNASPELADRLIRDKGTAAGIGIRFIESLLKQEKISPETMQILSNLRKDLEATWGKEIFDNDIIKQVLKEIELKLLSRATGEETWALNVQVANPPEDLNEIKSPLLRKKYFDYLSNLSSMRGKQPAKSEEQAGKDQQSNWIAERMQLRRNLLEDAEEGEEVQTNTQQSVPTAEKSELEVLEQKRQLRKNLLNDEQEG
jgi:hypothetical protein